MTDGVNQLYPDTGNPQGSGAVATWDMDDLPHYSRAISRSMCTTT